MSSEQTNPPAELVEDAPVEDYLEDVADPEAAEDWQLSW